MVGPAGLRTVNLRNAIGSQIHYWAPAFIAVLSKSLTFVVITILSYAAIAVCAEAQTISLSDRRSLDVRLNYSLPLSTAIPGCSRKNAISKEITSCSGDLRVHLLGPKAYVRTTEKALLSLSFLPHALVNKAAFSINPSSLDTLHQRCTLAALEKFEAWSIDIRAMSFERNVFATYLDPEHSWSYCFHYEAINWDFELNSNRDPQNFHHQFLLWRNGDVVGRMICSEAMRSNGRHVVIPFPQCRTDLWFESGEYHMLISSFSTSSISEFLSGLSLIVSSFFQFFEHELEGYEFDRTLFREPVTLSEKSEINISILEGRK